MLSGTTIGHFVPLLVPLPNCFIHLPLQLINQCFPNIDINRQGALAFELSWEEPNCGTIGSAIVGWVGNVSNSDSVELPIEFARCIGLFDALQMNARVLVAIHVLEVAPIAERVNVEPCTPDDWEIIELNAEFLETELLRQISVVYPDQKVPLWIHNNVLVHVWVLNEHEVVARLGAMTEIVIAPKTRTAQQNGRTDESVDYFKASPSFRVQPHVLSHGDMDLQMGSEKMKSITSPYPHVAMLHPSDFVALDGFHSCMERKVSITAVIWSNENSSAGECAYEVDVHTSEENKRFRKLAIATLLSSQDVIPGHIVLHAWTMASLQTSDLALVRLRIVNDLPSRVVKISLSSRNAISEKELILQFKEWYANSAISIPVLDTSIICLSDAVTCQMAFEFETNDTDVEQVQLIGTRLQYSLLNGRDLSELDAIRFHVVQPPTLPQPLRSTQDEMERYPFELGGISSIIRKIERNVLPNLNRRNAALRLLLRCPAPGYVLLNGSEGTGKTTILHAVSKALRHHCLSLVYTVFLSCRKLRNLKMAELKRKLDESFEKAYQHAPALIVLDDLDAIAPAESDAPGAPNEQAHHVAEHIEKLILQNQRQAFEIEAQIKQALEDQINEDDDAVSHALEHAAVNSVVHVIASARSTEAIHQKLSQCGLFDRPVSFGAADAQARQEILYSIVQRLFLQKHDKAVLDQSWEVLLDRSELIDATEGFSIKDMDSLLKRVYHQAELRRIKSDSSVDAVLTDEDVDKALAGFTPASLRGSSFFKSDVKWTDVGGLVDVRRVLKETLELPTRYAKLYNAAPIKLPSGVLLYGPPGCGKTLLAGAVANECGLNFISVKGPEVLNKYIGASEQAVRDLFGRAASAAPCILFLDEFDSIAPRRGADNTGVTDRVVNQLLTFLDGVESRGGVYVLAATSRPDMIDPALLRPGRLDKSLYCGFPEEEERLSILQVVAKKMHLHSDATSYLSQIAKNCHELTGADLNAILYSAQLEAVHNSLGEGNSIPQIQRQHIQKAVDETRPSISLQDRVRYDRIYASFRGSRTANFTTANSEFNNLQRTALA